jgi:hypothetical protein
LAAEVVKKLRLEKGSYMRQGQMLNMVPWKAFVAIIMAAVLVVVLFTGGLIGLLLALPLLVGAGIFIGALAVMLYLVLWGFYASLGGQNEGDKRGLREAEQRATMMPRVSRDLCKQQVLPSWPLRESCTLTGCSLCGSPTPLYIRRAGDDLNDKGQ